MLDLGGRGTNKLCVRLYQTVECRRGHTQKAINQKPKQKTRQNPKKLSQLGENLGSSGSKPNVGGPNKK